MIIGTGFFRSLASSPVRTNDKILIVVGILYEFCGKNHALLFRRLDIIQSVIAL